MKSLSQYMTESLINESAAGEIKSWAGSSYVAKPDAAQQDELKSVCKNIKSLAKNLSKISKVSGADAEAAILSFAKYVVDNIESVDLSNALEDWMSVVGLKTSNDEHISLISSIYDMIKKDSNGKIDPEAELA